ncbi:hypothetical protein [Taibaiella koreensis]|uniref:hypothetical protein n=1 Tax=Taibaiella koreensis TaxID=1268548 RepID=UPI000E59BD8B|nr:hypothetical protein [Taibaiella koreensis]
MSHPVQAEKPNISSASALWAVLIFAGLIIAAINFVQAESNSEGHGGHGAATEQHDGAGAHDEGHEAGKEAQAPAHGATEQAAPAAEGHDSAQGTHEAPAEKPAHEEAHH